MYVCCCCRHFQSLRIKSLLNHYNIVHSTELTFNVTCNVEDCPKKFNKYNSLYRHIRRHHENVYKGLNTIEGTEDTAENSDSSADNENDFSDDYLLNDSFKENSGDDEVEENNIGSSTTSSNSDEESINEDVDSDGEENLTNADNDDAGEPNQEGVNIFCHL